VRILWLAPYLPVPTFGGGTRTFNLIKTLSRMYEIDLIAGAETPMDEVPSELRSLCRTIRLFPRPSSAPGRKRLLQLRSLLSLRSAQSWMLYTPALQREINRAVGETHYDAVLVEHSFMGCYAVPDDQIVVLDQHNVESEIFRRAGRHERSLLRRGYNVIEYWKYRAEEQRACRRADLILATSDLDREAMRRWPSMPECMVVPNGVDTDFFSPQGGRAGRRTDVLFVGSMHYAPNTEAMLFFADQIWPRIRQEVPDATLSVVGMNPPPVIQALAERPGISVAGFVPDIRPHLSGAAVAVAPLHIGGGTRLKILEALAMGTAVVSTSVGCEGLDVQNGHHLLVADEPGAIADSVIALLRNPQRREALGREGRRRVVTQYDWRVLGQRLETALTDLLVQGRGRLVNDGDETAAAGIA
jgi:sugar transferase (PEP-CTERM/EpsH1 system associated)